MAVPAAAGRVSVTSFGYGHGDPPAASLTVDLRAQYRDPHADPALRELTAADPRVRAAVLATPGITDLITALTAAVREYLARGLSASLAVGCAGGRHRAPVIAAEVARQLGPDSVPVTLSHRDIGKPVIRRPAEPAGDRS